MRTAARARSLPARHPLAQGIALALALGAGATQADVFNVTTNADSGPGSLRQVVLDANTNPGADQITFSDGVGTIALTSGQIDITETLTITGPAAGQTVDAGGNSRIFGVTVVDQPLTLETLTLTGGRTALDGFSPNTCTVSGDGGGICAPGDVTLTNSTVSGNSTAGTQAYGGGLSVGGNATLTNSTVSGNSTAGDHADGGGLWVQGATTLTNSTVSGNSTTGGGAKGGGVLVWGEDATLTNSTVSGNSTAGDHATGGGLWVDGTVTLTNSTVSNNSTKGNYASGGGFFVRNRNATLINSTVTANQAAGGAGGIEVHSVHIFGPFFPPPPISLNLSSTLLGANSGPLGNFTAEIVNHDGSVTLNASNSLFGDDPSEVNGTNSANVFSDVPGLGPLADNGCAVPAGAPGSATCVQAHALLTGSSAIDAADDTVCAAEPVNNLDQRGEMRPADGDMDGFANCDIGAFELQAGTTPIDYDITGSWYNPATDGQGFSLEVVPASGVLAAYWFTYNLDGGAQMWLQGAGEIDVDVAQVPLQELTGGQFVEPTPPARIDWGTVTVRFFSDSSGEAVYASDVDGVDGVIPLQRITPPIACIEADSPPAETIDARFTGSWYDPTNSGQGFSLEVIPERNILVVYWFTYTVDGPAQMWLQGSGPITGDTAMVELARPIGGQFDEERAPSRPVWGTATIRFDTGASGEVSYESPVDGVSGTFPIERITPQAFCE